MHSDPQEWISFGAGLLWLGLAAWYAQGNRPEEPDPLRRVPRTAFAFVAGAAATFIAVAVAVGGFWETLPYVFAGATVVGLAAFLSALLVDLFGRALDAARTPLWLGAGIGIAILVTYCWLATLSRLFFGEGPSLAELLTSPLLLTPAPVAAATGLVWWSELPPPETGGPTAFD